MHDHQAVWIPDQPGSPYELRSLWRLMRYSPDTRETQSIGREYGARTHRAAPYTHPMAGSWETNGVPHE